MSIYSIKILASLILIATLFSLPIHAASTVVIGQDMPSGSLGPYMEFLVDPDNKMDLQAVQSAPSASQNDDKTEATWQKVAGDNIIGGFTDSVYWVRFSVQNTLAKERDWLLEVNYALLDRIELYVPDEEGGYTMTVGGDQLPFAERSIAYSDIVFPMLSAANSSATYYVRIQTTSSMYIELNIWTKDAFIEAIEGQLILHGVLYGVVLLATIYCLMNAIFMRERMYIFIALGIFGSSGYSMAINGFAFQYLWSENLWLQSVSIPFFMNVCFGFSLLYSREFLELKRTAPRTDTIAFSLCVLCITCAVLSLMLPYAIMIRISTVFAIVMSLMAFWAGVISFTSGNTAARFYLVGWLAIVIGAVTFAMKSLGLLPSNQFTVWMQEFGFAGIAIFLTISQSDRFFQAQRAHEDAQTLAIDAIRNAERKYRSLFENAIEGIFQMDSNGRLINANKAFGKILGIRDTTILLSQEHKPFSLHCLSDGERDRFRSILDKEQGINDFQTSFKLPSGEERWISVSVQRIRNPADSSSHFEGAMADITENKKRLLAEKQRHMAEASTEAKSLFLANMSHEIRTPMNAIIGFTDLALERNRDPQLTEFLRKTRMASGNLLGIINDILDFSKIEAGKLEIEDTSFSLQEVLNNLKNIVSVSVAAKNLSFRIMVDEDIPDKLIGDPLRIGQVLLNLTNNAIKFTQQGSVTVELDLISLEKKDMSIRLTGRVTDTGIGIAPDKLKTLFTSFTQADQSTTRRFGGTGLGLSISRQLVEMMGGQLTVDSKVDQGSTFSFTLQCRIQDRRQRSNPHFVDNQMPLNVLVVDDQPDARELLEKALLSLAHNVTCVASAELAIDELRNKQEAGNPYDVLIADWFMPDMDGIRCCQVIQESTQFIKPRMVIITGYDLEEAKQQSKQAGIDAFMLKPVKVPELANVLKEVFTDRRSSTEEPASENQAAPRYDFTGAKVLLVDDVSMNQELAQAILIKRGFDVVVASNGLEAVNSVRDGAFDLVLMDMQMPVMDGCQATEKIREFNRRLPIIAMTANAMTGDKNKCLAAGMNDYVTKPINPEELFRTIAHWFKPSTQTAHQPLPSVTSTNTLPDSLPGLALAQGIQRCEGNETLYRKLLADFQRNYSDSPSRLSAMLELNARDDITSFGHALKGVAGNLSALSLATIGAALEQAANLDHAELAQQIAQFNTELALVLSSISTLLDQAHPSTILCNGNDRFDTSELPQRMEHVLTLIQAQKLEAFDLASEYALNWPIAQQTALLQELIEALDGFEFGKAEEIAIRLRDQD